MAADPNLYYVYVISGHQNQSVARHDLARDIWEDTVIPKINVARFTASACLLNGVLYVVGGCDASQKYLNTIERLELGRRDLGWTLYRPSRRLLS